MSEVIVRTRESPNKKREKVSRVSRALALCVVTLGEVENSRLGFGRIVSAGLTYLRPELPDYSGEALDQAARSVLEAIGELVSEGHFLPLLPPPTHSVVLSPKDVGRYRTLASYGLGWSGVAAMTGITEDELRKACGARKRGNRRSVVVANTLNV